MPAAPTRYGAGMPTCWNSTPASAGPTMRASALGRLLHPERLAPLLLAGPVGHERGDRRGRQPLPEHEQAEGRDEHEPAVGEARAAPGRRR